MARLIDQILGQDQVWEKTGRGAELPHAIAFTGPAGIGKQKMAWAFAQRLLCTSTSAEKPCGDCGPCRRVENKQSEGVLFIEATGAQIKIESAHQVLEFLALARLSPARIIIINDAQLLNAQTANALLKVIEEPPPATHFFLIVPEISQLIATLRSRCQVLRFQPLSEELLKRGAEPPALEPWMLKSARGSFERLGIFRDEETNELRTLVFEFLAAGFKQERTGLTRMLENTKDRATALQAIRFLQEGLRDWTVLPTGELVHADFIEMWRQLPQAEDAKKVELWRHARAMEDDLQANVDRTLIFENFYYRSSHVLD